jgi:hypothetical protein
MDLAVPHLERLALGAGHVQPETVSAWHRQGFGPVLEMEDSAVLPGRPTLPREVRDLIHRMCRESPTWGAPCIHGELLKLGITRRHGQVVHG